MSATAYLNIIVTHNQFATTYLGRRQAFSTGEYFALSRKPASNAQVLSNTTVTWNNLGDANSCLTPRDTMRCLYDPMKGDYAQESS